MQSPAGRGTRALSPWRTSTLPRRTRGRAGTHASRVSGQWCPALALWRFRSGLGTGSARLGRSELIPSYWWVDWVPGPLASPYTNCASPSSGKTGEGCRIVLKRPAHNGLRFRHYLLATRRPIAQLTHAAWPACHSLQTWMRHCRRLPRSHRRDFHSAPPPPSSFSKFRCFNEDGEGMSSK